MKSEKDLRQLLESIDHRGYPNYKSTAGAWRFENYVLFIDHVQGDPFAAPSSLHVELAGNVAGIPAENIDTAEKRRLWRIICCAAFMSRRGNFPFRRRAREKAASFR